MNPHRDRKTITEALVDKRSRKLPRKLDSATDLEHELRLAETIASEINLIRQRNGKRWLAKISAAERLMDDLELDSLDLAELTVRLQAKFGVDVFAKRNLRTVGDVIEELGS